MMDNNNAVETPKEPEAPVSQTIAGIRFRSCGKIYTFDTDNIDVAPGVRVVVDSEIGISIGTVVTPKQIRERTKEPLKKILRIATDKDFETAENNRELEDEAKSFCIEKVKELGLPMKIVATESTLDKKRVTFYFTADGRIDFRELVRDLASKFKTRIEMRQIGVRDEVKLLGGFGCCGRQTCCSLFLTSFAPITIRMAKEQALSINQSKLSGVCGRLMCCLGYEYRNASSDKNMSRSSDKTPVKLPGEAAENDLRAAHSESSGPENAKEASLHSDEIRKTPGAAAPSGDTQQEKTGREKKRFRRYRKKRKRHQAEKASSENSANKPPLPAPARKTGQSETKGKGKVSNRRRRFWKKKQKEKQT